MKYLLLATALAAGAVPALAADTTLSVTVGQPGFYGRLDIGGYPPPRVIYRRPMAVESVSGDRQPIYLRVPPGHAKHWRKHCHEYDACNERVLFVRNDWYARDYVPRYRERQRNMEEGWREDTNEVRHGKGKGRRGHD